jgi:hypothetical protein
MGFPGEIFQIWYVIFPDFSDFGGFFVFCAHVFVSVFIFVLVWMGDAPSPYVLMLARAFADAAADLGKECVVNYESPSVPLRVVPPSEYAAVPSVPLSSASVPGVAVPDGYSLYNALVCLVIVCLFVLLVLFCFIIYILLGGF